MKYLLIKFVLLACIFLPFPSTSFATEINSNKKKIHNKIKHHYVEKVANSILSNELGLEIRTSNACAPDTAKATWVCYIFEKTKRTDKKSNDYDKVMDRLWSIEIDFIKGDYAIYKGAK